MRDTADRGDGAGFRRNQGSSADVGSRRLDRLGTHGYHRRRPVASHSNAPGKDLTTMLLVPTFAVPFLIVRATPVLLYRGHIDTAQRLPLALSSAVPSLSIVVVITEIGVRA